MSYARFGCEGSSVYVFAASEGHLECCGCSLGDKWAFLSTDAMLAHLRAHREAGHTVPDSTFIALEHDREENEEYIAAGGHRGGWKPS